MSREARREAFLDVAAELVQEGGVAAVSFESMATAAGVAKTLPYAYFEGVEDILVTLFERVVGGIDAAVDAVLSTDSLAFGAIVEQAICVWFDAVADHGRLVAALLDGRAHPGLAAGIRRALDAPDGAARIGAAGRERVIVQWSWRHTAERTVEHYRALLDQGR
jgi:AcrR family transcriptional regulator